jgi:molecular chaperone HscB
MGKQPGAPRRTVPSKCVSCERPLDSPLFCSSCRRLYPADGLSFFELFGLSPTYDVDAGAVRTKYFELARDIHPDRIGPGAEDTQRLSMRVAAQLNEAYRVLLDPVLRAEYLLELAGGKSAADDKQVPQEVLMDTLTLREEIEEAKAAGDQAALDRLRPDVQSRFDAALEEVAALARALPGGDETRAAMRGKLNAIRYYRKLLEQL